MFVDGMTLLGVSLGASIIVISTRRWPNWPLQIYVDATPSADNILHMHHFSYYLQCLIKIYNQECALNSPKSASWHYVFLLLRSSSPISCFTRCILNYIQRFHAIKTSAYVVPWEVLKQMATTVNTQLICFVLLGKLFQRAKHQFKDSRNFFINCTEHIEKSHILEN
jgi:hypothetical protein